MVSRLATQSTRGMGWTAYRSWIAGTREAQVVRHGLTRWKTALRVSASEARRPRTSSFTICARVSWLT